MWSACECLCCVFVVRMSDWSQQDVWMCGHCPVKIVRASFQRTPFSLYIMLQYYLWTLWTFWLVRDSLHIFGNSGSLPTNTYLNWNAAKCYNLVFMRRRSRPCKWNFLSAQAIRVHLRLLVRFRVSWRVSYMLTIIYMIWIYLFFLLQNLCNILNLIPFGYFAQ